MNLSAVRCFFFNLNSPKTDLSLMKVYCMLLYGSLVGVAQHLSIRSIRWAGIYETHTGLSDRRVSLSKC